MPRLKNIGLKDLKNLVNHPVHQLYTSDILECQAGFQNLVQVLKKFKSLQILVVNHFGYADDIEMLKELDCKFIIYLDRLKIKNMGIQKLISVLKMLNPEAIYLEGEFRAKNLLPQIFWLCKT